MWEAIKWFLVFFFRCCCHHARFRSMTLLTTKLAITLFRWTFGWNFGIVHIWCNHSIFIGTLAKIVQIKRILKYHSFPSVKYQPNRKKHAHSHKMLKQQKKRYKKFITAIHDAYNEKRFPAVYAERVRVQKDARRT